MSENNIPSVELLAQCAEINTQWLVTTFTSIVPVFYDDEYSNSWKLRIFVTRTKHVLMEHIRPEAADGHTLYLAVCAIREAHSQGITEGKLRAMEKVILNLSEVLGLRADQVKKHLNKE